VSIVPGQTALMRMPRGEYSTPALLVHAQHSVLDFIARERRA
jgi:hypothetical protein